MAKFASIIMVHYAQDGVRSATMRASLKSLFESTSYPFELIVIDNGGSMEDSHFLLDLCGQGKITHYIRNYDNLHFGFSRNQGLALAQGDYICIADNDLLYKKDWLSECVRLLDSFPEEKIYTTPVDYPTSGLRQKYNVGTLVLDGVSYQKNMRAGSNCFVMRRKDFEEVGKFVIHIIAGSRWTDTAVHKGYSALIIPGKLIEDLGLRKGYNFRLPMYCGMSLSDNSKVFFNGYTDAILQRSFKW